MCRLFLHAETLFWVFTHPVHTHPCLYILDHLQTRKVWGNYEKTAKEWGGGLLNLLHSFIWFLPQQNTHKSERRGSCSLCRSPPPRPPPSCNRSLLFLHPPPTSPQDEAGSISTHSVPEIHTGNLTCQRSHESSWKGMISRADLLETRKAFSLHRVE